MQCFFFQVFFFLSFFSVMNIKTPYYTFDRPVRDSGNSERGKRSNIEIPPHLLSWTGKAYVKENGSLCVLYNLHVRYVRAFIVPKLLETNISLAIATYTDYCPSIPLCKLACRAPIANRSTFFSCAKLTWQGRRAGPWSRWRGSSPACTRR